MQIRLSDAQFDLCLCCSLATKSGFLAKGPITHDGLESVFSRRFKEDSLADKVAGTQPFTPHKRLLTSLKCKIS